MRAVLFLFAALLTAKIGFTAEDVRTTTQNPVPGSYRSGLIAITDFPNIDCTGKLDSTIGVQAAIDAVPDDTKIVVPQSCSLKVKTIRIQNRTGITITGATRVVNSSATPTIPKFLWNGTDNGTMFSVTTSNHPAFENLFFGNAPGKNVGKFIDFDGQGGSATPTLALVRGSTFGPGNTYNPSYRAISISATATNNHELYRMEDNFIYCTGVSTELRSRAGSITTKSRTLLCSDCKFSSADVGKRIRISWPGTWNARGLLDTTIASVTGPRQAGIAANAPITMSNVTVHTGQGYGTGIYQGPSPNAKHQVVANNSIVGCEYGVRMMNGSMTIRDHNGTVNDTDIFMAGATEPVLIQMFTSEFSSRGIEIAGFGNFHIFGGRLENSRQFADGFWLLNGYVTASENRLEYPVTQNAVLIGQSEVVAAFHTFLIGNNFLNHTNRGSDIGRLGLSVLYANQYSAIANKGLHPESGPRPDRPEISYFSGDVQVNWDLYMPNVGNSGPISYACFDRSKKLVESSSPCRK